MNRILQGDCRATLTTLPECHPVGDPARLFDAVSRLEAWRCAAPTRWFWIDSPGSRRPGDADAYHVHLIDQPAWQPPANERVGTGRGQDLAAAILAALDDGKCEHPIEATATINDLAAQQGVRQVTNIDTLRTVDADPLELQRHIDELRQVDGSYCQRRQNDQNKAAP